MEMVDNVVVVPDLSPIEIVSQLAQRIELTSLDSKFKKWNFCQYRIAKGQPVRTLDVRGKRYEYLEWMPGKRVSTSQVWDHFGELRADGNTAAFIARIMQSKPQGYYASIPSDDALLFHGMFGRRHAPIFHSGTSLHGLLLSPVNRKWPDRWVFTAFRELP